MAWIFNPFTGTLDYDSQTENGMVYPAAGIALSTGSAWNTPVANNSTNWNTAYGWGNHAVAGYLLATGATTGATSQAQTFTNGVNLSNLTSGRVPYATTAGLLTDNSAFTFNGATGFLGATGFETTGDIYGANINYNEGLLSDPTITDADGVAISVTSVKCLIRSDALWDDGKLYSFTVPANATLAVTDNSINYIYVAYNDGSPIYAATTDRSILNNSNQLPVARIYMSGGNIEYQMLYQYIGRGATVRNFDRVMRIRGTGGIEIEGGLGLSETATRVVNVGSGFAWFGLSRKTMDAIVQGGAGVTSHLWYHSSGVWTSSVITAYNNTQYDNGTDLATLTTPSRYAVNWVFRNLTTNEIDIVLGTGDYTSAQAAASTVPALPPAISNFYVLCGRIIVAKSVDTAYAIENVTTSIFTQASITIHNDLSALDGGTTGEYYHLTSAQATIATQTATTDRSGYLSDTDWDTFNNKADANLGNLASVAINAALIPGTAGALDFGSTTKPWGDFWLAGTSGTPGTNQFKITGASTSGLRTITLPDASGTVVLSVATGNGVSATNTNGALAFTLGAITPSTVNGTYLSQGNNSLASNIAVGYRALGGNNSGGGENVAVGLNSLYVNSTGYQNTAIGNGSLPISENGNSNLSAGYLTLWHNVSGSENVALGACAGYESLGSNNIFIGTNAGSYETGSASFYVDTLDRSNTAGDKAGALLYGTFNATPASQTLKVNGTLSVLSGLNPVTNDGGALGTTALGWSDLHLASGGVINWNNGTYTITQNSGLLVFSGQLSTISATYPVFKTTRTSTTTNGTRSAFALNHTTTGDMADGFGVGFNFTYTDSGVADQIGAAIYSIRDGSDTESALIFYAGTGGQDEFLRINSAGTTILPNGSSLMVGGATLEAGSTNTIGIANGTAPDAVVANEVILYSVDTSDSKSTLGLYLEQTVEAIGTFTASHKLKICLNGTFYWITLDLV